MIKSLEVKMKNTLIMFVLIESNSVTTLAGYCNDLEIKSCKRYDDEYGKITNPTLAQYCSTVFKIENCLKGCDEALRKYKALMQKLYDSYGGYFSCDQLSRTDTEKIDSCNDQEVGSCTSIFTESTKINNSTSDQVCSAISRTKNCLGSKGCSIALNIFDKIFSELLDRENIFCDGSKCNSPGLCFILFMTVLCMAKHYSQQ